MIAATAYDEVIDFIASGTNPEKVIAFRVSQLTQKRVSELLFKEKLTELSPTEKSELDSFTSLEHLMRLAKARAFQILNERKLTNG